MVSGCGGGIGGDRFSRMPGIQPFHWGIRYCVFHEGSVLVDINGHLGG